MYTQRCRDKAPGLGRSVVKSEKKIRPDMSVSPHVESLHSVCADSRSGRRLAASADRRSVSMKGVTRQCTLSQSQSAKLLEDYNVKVRFTQCGLCRLFRLVTGKDLMSEHVAHRGTTGLRSETVCSQTSLTKTSLIIYQQLFPVFCLLP